MPFSVIMRLFLRHCEAIAEAIHNNNNNNAIESKQVDCHDSAFAESRNDDYNDSVNAVSLNGNVANLS